MNKMFFMLAVASLLAACGTRNPSVPVIGFVDAFEDNTIGQARVGFFDALRDSGFDQDKGNIKVIYRNAQGNIPTLTQIIKYLVAQKVALMATNPSLSTITAIQNTKEIPIFMMVSPTPALMKVVDAQGNSPKNLLGVAESLDYIDTSFLLIPKIIQSKKGKLTVGMIFNQSEPQSVESVQRITQLASANQITLIALPVNNSADVKLVTQSLLSRNIDVFFANPDNVVFASFETIAQACDQQHIPIFTSEAGLVKRGALAAYGADIYQWGFQAGEQAAAFLHQQSTTGMRWEMVHVRKKVFNPLVAQKFGLTFPANFQPLQ